MWDVIVVGAGPAGSYTAYRCARAGLEVLLLEKNTSSWDKPCGGAVNADTVGRLGPGSRRLIKDATNAARVFLNMSEIATYPQREYFFERDELDGYLAGMAREAGACLEENNRVASITTTPGGVTVETEDGARTGRLVVGADGVNSTIRRWAGLESGRRMPDRYLCAVTEQEVPEEVARAILQNDGTRHFFNIYFFSNLAGLAWVFPKGGRLNVGMGRLGMDACSIRARFGEMMAIIGLDPEWVETLRWHLVPCRPLDRIYGHRVLLVGDAAGFVNPWTGAGIELGLESAEQASQVALRCCRRGDFSEASLREYQARCLGILRPLRLRARFIRFVKWMMDHRLGAEIHYRLLLRTLAPLASSIGPRFKRPYSRPLRRPLPSVPS